MRRECSYCHRGYEKPGTENQPGVTHTTCPKCYLCVELAEYAKDNGLSLSEYFEENPDELKVGLNNLKDAIRNNDQWDNEPYTQSIDPDVEALYRTYERKVRSEVKRESQSPDRR